MGLCTKVVLDLVLGLEFSGLHLYTDNYYTSPLLYHHQVKMLVTNRKHFPIELVTPRTEVCTNTYPMALFLPVHG